MLARPRVLAYLLVAALPALACSSRDKQAAGQSSKADAPAQGERAPGHWERALLEDPATCEALLAEEFWAEPFGAQAFSELKRVKPKAELCTYYGDGTALTMVVRDVMPNPEAASIALDAYALPAPGGELSGEERRASAEERYQELVAKLEPHAVGGDALARIKTTVDLSVAPNTRRTLAKPEVGTRALLISEESKSMGFDLVTLYVQHDNAVLSFLYRPQGEDLAWAESQPKVVEAATKVIAFLEGYRSQG